MSRNRQSKRIALSTLSVALSAALAAAPLAAQETAPVPAAKTDSSEKAKALDKVTVTGSRIKRAEVEGPAPITTISVEQIEQEGFSSVYEALRTATQASGEAISDFNTGSFAPNARQVNLRGLGAGRTLMLINGRRFADYPWANGNSGNSPSFDSIPVMAIERVEVLSAGASAIYGSDAVAGVVNYILKDNFDGDEVRLRGSTTSEGGGDAYRASWVGGKTGDRWSLVYGLEARGNDPLYASERDFMDSLRDSPAAINPLTGFVPSTTLRLTSAQNKAGGPQNGFHVSPPAGTCEGFDSYAFTAYRLAGTAPNQTATPLGTVCGTEGLAARTFITGKNVKSGYVYGTWDFTDSLEGWASVMFNQTNAKLGAGMLSISGPQRYGGQVTPTGQVLTRGEGVTSTWYDAGYARRMTGVRRLTQFEHGGESNALQRFDERTFEVAAGLRGSFGESWDWDFTVSRGEFTSDMNRTLLNTQRVTDYFFGPQLAPSDPACAGAGTSLCYRIDTQRWFTPLTPQQYSELSDPVTYRNKSWVSTASFVLSGDLFELPAGPVGFAAVIDGTSQGYDTNPPDGLRAETRTNYGLLSTSGGGERDRYAAGVEFAVPITSWFKAIVAGRYDKYDDISAVDDAKTWNVGLEWRPTNNLLVRGNYSTSFKAPDMHFIYNEGTTDRPTINDDYRCVAGGGSFGGSGTINTCTQPGVYNYQIDARTAGDPRLEEETGESWGAGLVWDITDNMSMSLDYWDIELSGMIRAFSAGEVLMYQSTCRSGMWYDRSPFTDFALDSEFCNNMISRVEREAVSDVDGLEPKIKYVEAGYFNTASRRLNGIDASFRHHWRTDRFGSFYWNISWSHTLTSEQRTFESDPMENIRDVRTNNTLRSRTRGGAGWSNDGWRANVSFNRLGSLPSYDRNFRLAPHITWNANVSKDIGKHFSVGLFVSNVFNRFYSEDPSNIAYPYFNGWYGSSVLGREIALQIDYKFN